jgi:hypothetical protein
MKAHMTFLMAASLGVAGLVAGCDRNNTAPNAAATPPAATDNAQDAASRTGAAMNNAADRTGAAANNAANNAGNAVNNAADNAGDNAQTAADRTGNAMGNAANSAKNAAKSTGAAIGNAVDAMTPSATGNVQDMIGEVTNAALTENGLDDLTERFTQADQDRLKSYVNNEDNLNDLNAKVKQLRTDWKNKYNDDFKMGNESQLLSGLKLSNMTSENGVNKATATLPAENGKAAVNLHLVRESGAWKIDVPDSLTGQQLKQSVIQALDKVDQMKDRWPADQNQAYRSVAHDVLTAISNAG